MPNSARDEAGEGLVLTSMCDAAYQVSKNWLN